MFTFSRIGSETRIIRDAWNRLRKSEGIQVWVGGFRYLKAHIRMALIIPTGGISKRSMPWLSALAAPSDCADATALHMEH